MKRAALALVGFWTLTSAACSSGGGSNPADDGDGSGGSGGSSASGSGGRGGSGGTTGGGSGGSTSGSGGAAAGTGGSAGSSGGSGGSTGGSDASAGPADGAGGGADTGAAQDSGGASDTAGPGVDGGAHPMMSFFVTSVGAGMGGNLGGLEGADQKCKELATAVGVGNKTWRAYLSTSTVNARTRIGNGPWHNAKGVIIANDLATLHDGQGMDGALNATWPIGAMAVERILDEKGNVVPSGGGMPQRHDILTGSNMAGMANGDNHCNNWTSTTGTSTVGHSNRTGGGRPPSWNFAHTSACGAITGDNLQGTVGQGGGRGSIYCFAAD